MGFIKLHSEQNKLVTTMTSDSRVLERKPFSCGPIGPLVKDILPRDQNRGALAASGAGMDCEQGETSGLSGEVQPGKSGDTKSQPHNSSHKGSKNLKSNLQKSKSFEVNIEEVFCQVPMVLK